MIQPGDVVIADFPGVTGIKRRPAIVVSTDEYHQHRPDAILGLVTSNVVKATLSTDYTLQDWSGAGLHKPSAFRSFLLTIPRAGLTVIGHVSDRDWDEVKSRMAVAVATT